MITWENYEEYMARYADQDLTTAEEADLKRFVNTHPGLEKELAAYEMTRLTPDPSQVYGFKDSLIKPVATRKTIAFPWQRYSIAAGVAAIIIVSLFRYNYTGTNGASLPKLSVASPAVRKTSPAASGANLAPQSAKIAQTAVESSSHTGKKTVVVPIKYNNVVAVREIKKTGENTAEQKPSIQPGRLSIAAVRTLPEDMRPQGEPALLEVPGMPPIAAPPARKTFFDMLPLDEEKKEGLKSVVATVNNVYKEVSDIKDDIKEKRLSIRIEKRKILITF